MHRTFGALCALPLLWSACGPSVSKPIKKPAELPGDKAKLADIPVEVDAKRLEARAGHDPSAASPLLSIMSRENARWMQALPKTQAPAYFLGYQIHDKRIVVLEAESGALTVDADEQNRSLHVEVRVGSPKRDNRHPLKDQGLAQLSSAQHLGTVPRTDDPKSVAHHLWLETDRQYRHAAQTMRLVQTQEQVAKDSSKEDAPDYSLGQPENFIQPIAELEWNRADWETRVRQCSKNTRKGVATRGTCRVDAEVNTIYYVNSEGSVIQKSWTTSRFVVSAGVKADDGMPLSRLEQEFAPKPSLLPTPEKEKTMIEAVVKDLSALHKAPVVSPWAGPVVLEGRATAVFFHEVFGHRIEGHRQKSSMFGRTFTDAVGKQIMPSWLSVYDDPSIRKLGETYLNGYYQYDDEGVLAERVPLVESGVLKGFLMGRSPIDGFPKSNGHGRSDPNSGLPAVARQGNLVVEASRSLSKEELHARLVEEIKAQGKDFGMIFSDISGGYTNTTTMGSQTFKVQPIMAYRVFADGRKELVRGVDISGSPLTVLENLLAAARPLETFNGMCGAESGWVPVSASAPSLLVKTLEVERGFEPTNIDPVLPAPSIGKTVSGHKGN